MNRIWREKEGLNQPRLEWKVVSVVSPNLIRMYLDLYIPLLISHLSINIQNIHLVIEETLKDTHHLNKLHALQPELVLDLTKNLNLCQKSKDLLQVCRGNILFTVYQNTLGLKEVKEIDYTKHMIHSNILLDKN